MNRSEYPFFEFGSTGEQSETLYGIKSSAEETTAGAEDPDMIKMVGSDGWRKDMWP